MSGKAQEVAAPDSFFKEYSLGGQLGKGNFGIVYDCTELSSGRVFAAKVVKRLGDEKSEGMVRNEVAFLKEVGETPNIVSLRAFFEDDKAFCLVMEKMHGGDVMDDIVANKRMSEAVAQHTILCLARAIDTLHSLNIVHRDIKPENLLLSQPTTGAGGGGGTTPTPPSPGAAAASPLPNIKLADFGLAARAAGGTSLNGFCGTPFYVAPEVCREKPYGKPCDMWAIGAVLYNLISGWPPFFSDNTLDLLEQIKKGNVNFKSGVWNQVSEECKDCIRKLLVTNPYGRMNVKALLEHPFMVSAARNEPLEETIKQLTTFHARRKFRAAARAVMAAGKMKGILRALQKKPEDAPVVSKRTCSQALADLRRVLGPRLEEQFNGPAVAALMKELGFGTEIPFDFIKQVLADEHAVVPARELMCALGLLMGGRGEEALKFCFEVLDADASGTLNRAELVTLFQFFDYEDEVAQMQFAGEALLAVLFEKLDRTMDGELSFAEFRQAMLSEPMLARAWIGTVKKRQSVALGGSLMGGSAIEFPRPSGSVASLSSPQTPVPTLDETKKADLELLNARLLHAIADGDWEIYASLCSPKLTAFEPEACGSRVEGLDFHKFYFGLPGRTKPNTTVTNLKVQFIAKGEAAVITYNRLMQIPSSPPVTLAFEETRIWEHTDGHGWQCMHLHRSKPTTSQ